MSPTPFKYNSLDQKRRPAVGVEPAGTVDVVVVVVVVVVAVDVDVVVVAFVMADKRGASTTRLTPRSRNANITFGVRCHPTCV